MWPKATDSLSEWAMGWEEILIIIIIINKTNDYFKVNLYNNLLFTGMYTEMA